MSDALVLAAPSPRVESRWRRWSWLLFAFACGGLVGTAGGSYWMRERMLSMIQHPDQAADRIMPRIQAALDLDEAQTRRVEEIVRRRHAAMEAQRAESYPRQLAEFAAMRSEVAAGLRPSQQAAWTSLCDAVEQRYLPIRPAGPPPADLLFSRFDENQDDILQQDEVPGNMWRRLVQADQDGDGMVTREEYQKASANLQPSGKP